MRHGHRPIFLIATVTPASSVAMAARPTHRMHDPYYRDYHVWDGHEVAYYERWETETRRHRVEFKERSADERKEYWTWRHNQRDTVRKAH
jgi:hypothetical protein